MRSTALRGLFRLFSVALIAVLVLLVVSCRSTRTQGPTSLQTAQEQHQVTNLLNHHADSVARQSESTQQTLRLLYLQPIQADTALLSLPLDSVSLLPSGAAYTARHGRAHVTASLKRTADGRAPTLLIESGCDSLMEQCLLLERENVRLKEAYEQRSDSVRTVDKQHSNTTREEQTTTEHHPHRWLAIMGIAGALGIWCYFGRIFNTKG